MDLLELLFEALELNPENYAMWIKYALELGCTLVKIVNDGSVKFYLKLKNNEPNKTRLSLCVDIMGEPMSMTNEGKFVKVSKLGNVCRSQSVYVHGKLSLP